jgi:hypothetical protein
MAELPVYNSGNKPALQAFLLAFGEQHPDFATHVVAIRKPEDIPPPLARRRNLNVSAEYEALVIKFPEGIDLERMRFGTQSTPLHTPRDRAAWVRQRQAEAAARKAAQRGG